MNNHTPVFRIIRDRTIPVFRQDHNTYSLFYTPGLLTAVDHSIADSFEEKICDHSQHTGATTELRKSAENAILKRDSILQAFKPVCLTLYLSNECNLDCEYCFSDTSSKKAEVISTECISAAAKLVAQNCKERGLPFTVVFNGGGEPSLYQHSIDNSLNIIESITKSINIPIFKYITSNGVMPEARAIWMTERFDLIGLSCDGPEDIQLKQRKIRGGGSSTPILERTAEIIRESGKPLHVRVTITPESINRLPEISRYICETLKPIELNMEPVYQGGRTGDFIWGINGQAEEFIRGFFEAKEIASSFGITLLNSGSRLSEIHGNYCHVNRQVLHLVPGEVSTSCFKCVTAEQVIGKKAQTGWFNENTGAFIIEQADQLQAFVNVLPEVCQSCFNQFHCVHQCPDSCPLENEPFVPGFRCEVAKGLASHQLQQLGLALKNKLSTQQTVSMKI